MSEPQINVDHFYHRPTYNVVSLLTDKPEIPAVSADLESAGIDVAAVEILCGELGVRIWMAMAATTGCEPGGASRVAVRLRRDDRGDLRRGAQGW